MKTRLKTFIFIFIIPAAILIQCATAKKKPESREEKIMHIIDSTGIKIFDEWSFNLSMGATFYKQDSAGEILYSIAAYVPGYYFITAGDSSSVYQFIRQYGIITNKKMPQQFRIMEVEGSFLLLGLQYDTIEQLNSRENQVAVARFKKEIQQLTDFISPLGPVNILKNNKNGGYVRFEFDNKLLLYLPDGIETNANYKANEAAFITQSGKRINKNWVLVENENPH